MRRAEAGETILDAIDSEAPRTSDDDGKIEALAEMICCCGEGSVAALLVLMAALENSTRPKALANIVKHFGFNRCGMVDAQIAVIEGELFAGNTAYVLIVLIKQPVPTTGYLARTQLTKGPHMSNTNLIPVEKIEKAIYLIRGERKCWIAIWHRCTTLRPRC